MILRISDDYYTGYEWRNAAGQGKPFSGEVDVEVPDSAGYMLLAVSDAYFNAQELVRLMVP